MCLTKSGLLCPVHVRPAVVPDRVNAEFLVGNFDGRVVWSSRLPRSQTHPLRVAHRGSPWYRPARKSAEWRALSVFQAVATGGPPAIVTGVSVLAGALFALSPVLVVDLVFVS